MTKNTLIALFSLPFVLGCEPLKAGKVHGMEDLKDDRKETRYFVKTVVKNTAKEEKKEHAEPEFPGKGHRLGGDRYVNRLLDIDHDTGKRLAKKHHHHHHHDEVKDSGVQDITLEENKENTSLMVKGSDKKMDFAKNVRKMHLHNFAFSNLVDETRG